MKSFQNKTSIKQKDSEFVDEYGLRVYLAAKKAVLESKDPNEKKALEKINANDKLLVHNDQNRYNRVLRFSRCNDHFFGPLKDRINEIILYVS